ncbi:MAG: PhnD/SsuA/transferrin family substrate-binding protein [Sinobacteraceae bacterium]|nr:PhnD/SsuA/transferrin family substrate-binding protein [Nevskiaceae bacterium]MBV9912327.1 PhnD/SsuA/transferrin family substrate-binding protein [Nevskiaceae bacterium]
MSCTHAQLIAGLPMYDFPYVAAAHDSLWKAMAGRLRDRGIAAVPATLTRDRGHIQLWKDPGLLFAQACEFPVAKGLAREVRPLATPRYAAAGCEGNRYRSAVLVRTEDAAQSLIALRGRRCAVNEPDSNSGMNLLRVSIAPLAGGQKFFNRVIVSGSHRASAVMVAENEADVAALDCVTLAHLQRQEPKLTARLRVLCWTPSSPCLPFITSRQHGEDLVQALRRALQDVLADPALTNVRSQLFLSGADFEVDESYPQVIGYERRAAELGYPELA